MFRIYLTLILLALFSVSSHAQAGALQFVSPDSLDIELYLDETMVEEAAALNEDGDLSILLDSLSLAEHYLDVLIQDSLNTFLRTELQIDSLTIPVIALTQVGETYTLELANPGAVTRDFTSFEASQATLQVQVNVSEQATCGPPASPAMMQAWMNEIVTYEFERDRSKLLKQVLGVSCLTTQQIELLVSQVEDEERRVELLKKGYEKCFNRRSYDQLSNMLYLSRNKEAFYNWLESNG